MVQLTDHQRENIVNFGCAIVVAELSANYDACAQEPVAASLFELLGADRTTPVEVIAQISEGAFELTLDLWTIPDPGGFSYDAQGTQVRNATMVERGRAKLAWDFVVPRLRLLQPLLQRRGLLRFHRICSFSYRHSSSSCLHCSRHR